MACGGWIRAPHHAQVLDGRLQMWFLGTVQQTRPLIQDLMQVSRCQQEPEEKEQWKELWGMEIDAGLWYDDLWCWLGGIVLEIEIDCP